jgi:hypothetical protein
MHITNAVSPTRSCRWRASVATLIVGVCATLALAIGGAAVASAAGPATIGPGAEVIFPTNLWLDTEICAENLGAADGSVLVDPFPFQWGWNNDETVNVRANDKTCIKHWYLGNVVKLTNRGSTDMKLTSQ